MTACFNSPAFHLKPSPLNALIFWRKFTKPVQSLVVAALVFVPVVSFAQSDHPLTRADVRAELVQLRKAGYKPASDNTQYPQNIETALARINVKNGLAGAAYGGVENSSSASGSRPEMTVAPAAGSVVGGLGRIHAHS